MKDKTLGIILAGGSGERFKTDVPKQFFKVAGKLVLEHTVEIFEKHSLIDDIYIIVNSDYINKVDNIFKKRGFKKIKKILKGGKTRQESSRIGIFEASKKGYAKVLTHDAIRPLLSNEIITNIIKALDNYKSVSVAIPTADTIIRINSNNVIQDIPKRKYLMREQTPQGFRIETIEKAHRLALKEKFESSPEDCYLVLRYNLADTYVVMGSETNIKLTYQIDLQLLERIFQLKTKTIQNIDISEIKSTISNKTYVIFGGTKGIGKSINDLCLFFGAKAYSFGSDLDIRNYQSIEKTLNEIYKKENKIDGIFITAGSMEKGFLQDLDIKNIDNQINVNLTGNILASKISIPFLKESKGHLVLFASSSYIFGREEYTIYCATKAGLVDFMQGLSQEVSDLGIKVNIINPERTLTPMRITNFKAENQSLLLDPKFVALMTLQLLTMNITGSVIDVRKNMERPDLLETIKTG